MPSGGGGVGSDSGTAAVVVVVVEGAVPLAGVRSASARFVAAEPALMAMSSVLVRLSAVIHRRRRRRFGTSGAPSSSIPPPSCPPPPCPPMVRLVSAAQRHG